jgi:hypothetical protein
MSENTPTPPPLPTESAAAPTAGRTSKCSIAYHEIPLLSLASLDHNRPECARELGLIHDRGDGLSGAPRPPGVLGGLGGLEGALSRLSRLIGLGRLEGMLGRLEGTLGGLEGALVGLGGALVGLEGAVGELDGVLSGLRGRGGLACHRPNHLWHGRGSGHVCFADAVHGHHFWIFIGHFYTYGSLTRYGRDNAYTQSGKTQCNIVFQVFNSRNLHTRRRHNFVQGNGRSHTGLDFRNPDIVVFQGFNNHVFGRFYFSHIYFLLLGTVIGE